MWQSVEIASHIHKLRERSESCSFAKQNTYCINQFIYYKKWVNRPLNLILSESSQFFCANRPVRFFARIVPVESSQGGTGFCAKRPVTNYSLAFVAGLKRATDEGSLPEIAQYSPYYLPLNVFTASKGSNLYILFPIMWEIQSIGKNIKERGK